MKKIEKDIIDVLEVMKESIKLNCPEEEMELERLEKIKDYINTNEVEKK